MAKEIKLSIITAPRSNPTLNFSIGSIRRAGYTDVITIFAEPGEYDIADKGVDLRISKEKLGCFKNFHRAFEYNSMRQQLFCVLSDDFIYRKGIFRNIALEVDYESYRALYTPMGMQLPPCNIRQKGWQTINKGWANSYGGLYVMFSEVARKIIAHPKYQDHLKNYDKNEQVDHIIPEVCYQLGIDQWFHNPSFADHVGKVSTLGHAWNNSQGLNFRG